MSFVRRVNVGAVGPTGGETALTGLIAGYPAPSRAWRRGDAVAMTERVGFIAASEPNSRIHGGVALNIRQKCTYAGPGLTLFDATRRGSRVGLKRGSFATHDETFWSAGWFRRVRMANPAATPNWSDAFQQARSVATDWTGLAPGQRSPSQRDWNCSIPFGPGHHTANVRTSHVSDVKLPGAGRVMVMQTAITTTVPGFIIRVNWWFATKPGLVVRWRARISGLLAPTKAQGDNTIVLTGVVVAYRLGGRGPMTVIGWAGR
ncbi:MAG: hypothetical protein KGJ62_11175 [Armatimonadetes bacterium]|nr:hypothetical protein [Armatimonadota bacterium]MDE2206307.1 hypothetical protein [Armatimonadota bacterium]